MKYWKAKLICLFLGIKIDRKIFGDIEYKQYQKGLEKYGKSLADCDFYDYSWSEMAIEEIIDLLMYADKLHKRI